MVLIEIVRGIAGKTWSPDEIRFRSDFKVCNAAREANPNTRFINQSSHTSIVFPSSLLAASKATFGMASLPSPSVPTDPDVSYHLKRLLRPYLRVKAPKIDLLAEIAGTSPRTLQRKLKQSGTSYSELIETTRFELAMEMLKDTDTRLVEIAMELGFENQSNFGRNFKRIAGISPGRYRRDMLRQDCAA
jgi:AraC-like DNA-binding protein